MKGETLTLASQRRGVVARKQLVRAGLVLGLISMLSACALVPGTSGWDMRSGSSVALPVAGPDKGAAETEQVPANVTVTPITAELIIAQVRDAESTFRSTQAGGRTAARQPTVPDFGLMHQDYEIGPGDIINVTVWDHPEITIPAGSYRSAEASGTLVADDGTIFFPFAGTVKVGGKTTRQVRDILSQRLSKVIENVQLDVRVISFRSKRVYVVGEVKQPGLQAINDIQMTMLEAINRAGGITEEADHGNVLLTRAGETWRVDLQALYEDGEVSQNVSLLPGDIVNVPDRQLNKVFVLGEVKSPGSFVMNKRRITLAEALSEAGYVNQITADASWIYVMRSDTGSSELFHLNAGTADALLLAERFPLRPRDIVYVDVAAIARWNRVVSNILPTSQMLNQLGDTRYPLFSARQP